MRLMTFLKPSKNWFRWMSISLVLVVLMFYLFPPSQVFAADTEDKTKETSQVFVELTPSEQHKGGGNGGGSSNQSGQDNNWLGKLPQLGELQLSLLSFLGTLFLIGIFFFLIWRHKEGKENET
ncbi:hypothetical protein [Vagococcus humatus]|uniref:Gram-positive cocci surface proteins LPxTG domain-containing protein n=1 Tax=Vagococcus humatus TaxID=1889241 RepID=A0A3S0GEC6_9ENTE|nr:hypothetical protein [Vagococcus humatus]RST89830.1 hypothetical protein C7P63_01760 [Vagococcus humatus]